MIAMLAGKVDQAGRDQLVLDVNGVGYLVFCSSRTFARMPGRGEAAKLLVETHVREDHIHLYGFADEAEQGVVPPPDLGAGVGARLALAVLSALAPDVLATAIVAQDKATRSRAPRALAQAGPAHAKELKDKEWRLMLVRGAGQGRARAARRPPMRCRRSSTWPCAPRPMAR